MNEYLCNIYDSESGEKTKYTFVFADNIPSVVRCLDQEFWNQPIEQDQVAALVESRDGTRLALIKQVRK